MAIFTEDTSFRYVVQYNDNSIVLTNVPSVSATWQNPKDIDIRVQYLNPSTLSYEGTRQYTSSYSFDSVDVSSSFWDRGDSVNIAILIVLLCFSVIFIGNIFTKFLRPGGAFFG